VFAFLPPISRLAAADKTSESGIGRKRVLLLLLLLLPLPRQPRRRCVEGCDQIRGSLLRERPRIAPYMDTMRAMFPATVEFNETRPSYLASRRA